MLATFTSTQRLSLRCHPDLVDLGWLAALRHLVQLDLGLTDVAKAGLRVVATSLPALRDLSLEEMPASTSLAPLQKLQHQLTALDVSSNRASIATLDLAAFTELRRLNVADNDGLDDVAFVATMAHLEDLHMVGLGGGGSSDSGGVSLAPLRFCTKLQHLAVDRHDDLDALQDLVVLQHLVRLENVRSLQPLAKLVNLEELKLDCDRHHGVLLNLAPLTHLTKLCVLVVRNARVRNLGALAKLRSLRELALPRMRGGGGAATTVIDLAPLAQLTRLDRLDLHDNRAVASFAFLRALSALTSLTLSRTNIRDVAVCAAMTRLQSLHLVGAPVANVASLDHLTDLRVYLDVDRGAEGPALWRPMGLWW